MSISTELARIKSAKSKIAGTMGRMGLTNTGLIGAMATELDGISVFDYENTADSSVTVEDEGTTGATWNLFSGYYKNDFQLTHPDAVENSNDETLTARVAELEAQLVSIENELKSI